MSSSATCCRAVVLLLGYAVAALPAAHAQLTIAGGTFTVGPATTMSVGGSITVAGSGTLDNQGTVTLTGDLTNTGTIGSGAGLWQLNGSTLQTLTTAGATLATLDVANAAGGTLGQPLTLGTLTLSGGYLRLAGSNLTVTSSITGSTASRFVVTNGAGQLYHPVGTSATVLPIGPADASYRPLSLTRSTGTGQYVLHVATGALTAGNSGTPYTTHAVAMRWEVAPPDAVPYTLTTQWAGADELPSFARATSAVARWNGSLYVPTAFGAASGSDPYQRSSSGLTSGGTFIVLDNAAPLPVELTRFEAQRPPGQPRAELTWATAAEVNNAGFEVQRQDEGQATFHRVGFVPGHGNSLITKSYAFTDPNAFSGPSYYRLRQLDTDGTEGYSPVRVVGGLPAGTAFSLGIYPNPARTTATLDATGPVPAGLTLTLLAADGRLVWQRPSAGLSLATPLDVSQLAAGTYLLRYQAADGTHGTRPLIVAP